MPDSTNTKGKKKIRLVCLSDTHNHGPGEGFTLPLAGGDILIHAGDLTNQGSIAELKKAVTWLRAAKPYRHKVVIAGNHDLALDAEYRPLRDDRERGWSASPSEEERAEARALFRPGGDTDGGERVAEDGGFIYLEHESIVLDLSSSDSSNAGESKHEAGSSKPIMPLTIFGSPYTPSSHSVSRSPSAQRSQIWAFQYPASSSPTSPQSHPQQHPWQNLPNPTILITHGPAHGLLDTSAHWGPSSGCRSLLSVLRRARPLVHVSGHCHEGRGAMVVRWGGASRTDGDDDDDDDDDNNNNNNDEVVYRWEDPAQSGGGGKKMSLLDLTGTRPAGYALQAGRETAVVNAAIMGRSWGRKGDAGRGKAFNKPIVVDVFLPGPED